MRLALRHLCDCALVLAQSYLCSQVHGPLTDRNIGCHVYGLHGNGHGDPDHAWAETAHAWPDAADTAAPCPRPPRHHPMQTHVQARNGSCDVTLAWYTPTTSHYKNSARGTQQDTLTVAYRERGPSNGADHFQPLQTTPKRDGTGDHAPTSTPSLKKRKSQTSWKKQ